MKHFTKSVLNACTILIVFSIFTTSCIPHKKILYLQNKDSADLSKGFVNKSGLEYKIQPGDNLFIRIFSLDEKTSNLFNMTQGTYSQYLSNDASIYLYSYTVNDSGFVELPVIGFVFIKNKTTEQARMIIQKEVDRFLKDAVVTIKLVSFYITVLGEVTRPGKYPVYQNQINIFEAIGQAGDITTFGNRNNVTLVRQSNDRSLVKHIDLTDIHALESENYYLMPDDIIYVEPLKGRNFAFESFPYAVFLSIITTTLLILNFFK